MDLIDLIYSEGVVLDKEGKTRDAFPATLPRADGEILHAIVRDQKRTRTLEIGMAFGVSSLFILSAQRENGSVNHTAVDPFQSCWFDNIGRLNVERAGFADSFRFIEKPSYLALSAFIEAGEQFDFIFIDGNHRFEYALVDFFLAEKLLPIGGIAVFHDMWMPSIAKVVTFVGCNRRNSFAAMPEYMAVPRSVPASLRRMAGLIRRNPYDVKVARYLARKQFRNCAVFRKTAQVEEVDYAGLWDEYESF